MKSQLPHSQCLPHRLRSCTPSGRLGDYCDTGFLEYLAVNQNRSPQTIQSYRLNLNCFQKYLTFQKLKVTIQAVQKKDIEDYFVYLSAQGVKYASKKMRLCALKSFFNYCLGEGYVEVNPAAKTKMARAPKRDPTPVPVVVLDHLKSALKAKDSQGKRWRRHKIMLAGIHLLFGSGLRISELRNMRYEDIIFRHPELGPHVRLVKTKGMKPRMVPLNLDTLTAMKGLSGIPMIKRCGYVYGRTALMPFTISSWERWMRDLQAELNLPVKYRLHDIRASFATQLALNGTTLPVLTKLGGWESVETAGVYLNVEDKQMIAEYNRCHPRGNEQGGGASKDMLQELLESSESAGDLADSEIKEDSNPDDEAGRGAV